MSTDMVRSVMRQINYGTGKTQTRRVVTGGTTTWDGGAWPSHLRDYRLYKSDQSWIDNSFPDSPILKVERGDTIHRIRPRIEAGDLLYVRENFCWRDKRKKDVCYFADRNALHELYSPWKPSIHMPRSASRITLKVTDVRFEAIHDISSTDILAEGIYDADRDPAFPPWTWSPKAYFYDTPRGAFRELWDVINAERGFEYDKNPYVVVIEFEPVLANVDEVTE